MVKSQMVKPQAQVEALRRADGVSPSDNEAMQTDATAAAAPCAMMRTRPPHLRTS